MAHRPARAGTDRRHALRRRLQRGRRHRRCPGFRPRLLPPEARYIVAPWNTSATKYWLDGDPADCNGLEVGFVNGRDSPELFVADDPREGAGFSNDQLAYKVRFVFGVCIVNWRPFVGYMT